MTKPLWTPAPERTAQCNMRRFMTYVNQMHHLALTDYDELYAWSITEIPAFWEAVWRFVISNTRRRTHLSWKIRSCQAPPGFRGPAQLRREPVALSG